MGQQQLLLLVLGVVIVGLAVVVGIEAFEVNDRKARLDGLANDAVRIAAEVQAWSLKSPVYGGPEEGGGFSAVTMDALGYRDDAGVYETLNGRFVLTDTQADCVRLLGVPPEFDVVNGDPADLDHYVQVVITGAQPSDVEMSTDGTALSC